MLAFKRISTMVQPARLSCAVVQQPLRCFGKLEDIERGNEKSYFSKQDAKMLKKLVEKMESRDEQANEAVQEHCAVSDDLEQIFVAHNMQKDGKDSLLWQELMEWRRHKY